jgi:hypothetical protein
MTMTRLLETWKNFEHFRAPTIWSIHGAWEPDNRMDGRATFFSHMEFSQDGHTVLPLAPSCLIFGLWEAFRLVGSTTLYSEWIDICEPGEEGRGVVRLHLIIHLFSSHLMLIELPLGKTRGG